MSQKSKKCGAKLDANGYAPSIMQEDMTRCYLCGRADRKLDRHEPFGGAFRDKSKKYGLWVLLCHEDCHEGRNGAHGEPKVNEELKRDAQLWAMHEYKWSKGDFIREFGKNYL